MVLVSYFVFVTIRIDGGYMFVVLLWIGMLTVVV